MLLQTTNFIEEKNQFINRKIKFYNSNCCEMGGCVSEGTFGGKKIIKIVKLTKINLTMTFRTMAGLSGTNNRTFRMTNSKTSTKTNVWKSCSSSLLVICIFFNLKVVVF